MSTSKVRFVNAARRGMRLHITTDGAELRSLGRSIPRSFVRISSALIRRIRLRRRLPRPEDFARMSPAQIESYIRSIGFDQDVRDALAEYEGGPNQARLGSGVPNAQGGPGKR